MVKNQNPPTVAQNKATVGSMYEAFGRGDVPFILSQFSPNFILDARGGARLPYAGMYRGASDVANYFIGLNEAFETTAFDVTSIIGEGNNVAAFGSQSGKARTSGKPFAFDWAMYWVFNAEGWAEKCQIYYDTAGAEAAYLTA